MVPPNIPSNLPNLVAPFLPAGQRPVGQESAESRKSTFKPVEQPAQTAHAQVQLNEHASGDQAQGQGEQQSAESGDEGAEDAELDQSVAATERNAADQDAVPLYSASKLGRKQLPPAPRGCLLDDTV